MLDPIVGGALVTGASSLLSSIFGTKSQSDANKTNLKIAQMNNEWSERMMEKQNQYDIDMWNRNNEYNSASAQVERLKEAGLNPALFMGSGAAGQASGGSSVGLPSPTSAKVEPIQYGGYADAVKSAVLFAQSIAKNQADINFMETQSDVMKAETAAKIAELGERTRGLKYDTDYKQIMESTRASIENEDYLMRVQNREIGEINKALMGQTRILNDIQITHLPDQMKADIALKLAQADSLTMPELAKELKFFEKRFGYKITKSELTTIFKAWKFEHNRYKFGGLPDLIGGGISGGIASVKNALGW